MQGLRRPPCGTAGQWYGKPNFHTKAPPLGRHLQIQPHAPGVPHQERAKTGMGETAPPEIKDSKRH
eukprot:363443-Chlamydomonas_euryale.AAC.1